MTWSRRLTVAAMVATTSSLSVGVTVDVAHAAPPPAVAGWVPAGVGFGLIYDVPPSWRVAGRHIVSVHNASADSRSGVDRELVGGRAGLRLGDYALRASMRPGCGRHSSAAAGYVYDSDRRLQSAPLSQWARSSLIASYSVNGVAPIVEMSTPGTLTAVGVPATRVEATITLPTALMQRLPGCTSRTAAATFLTLGSGGPTFVVLRDTGVPDEVTIATVDRMIGSLRAEQPRVQWAPLGD